MAISNSEKDAAYSYAFDNFVRQRNIDIDDRYWSEEDNNAWGLVLVQLREVGVIA